jgi:hypothetical protein
MSKTLKEMEKELQLEPTVDQVNHPPHYTTGGIETLDVIRAKMSPDRFEGYLMGNVLKYLLRCEYKERRQEDIRKAQFYLNTLIVEMDINDTRTST